MINSPLKISLFCKCLQSFILVLIHEGISVFLLCVHLLPSHWWHSFFNRDDMIEGQIRKYNVFKIVFRIRVRILLEFKRQWKLDILLKMFYNKVVWKEIIAQNVVFWCKVWSFVRSLTALRALMIIADCILSAVAVCSIWVILPEVFVAST